MRVLETERVDPGSRIPSRTHLRTNPFVPSHAGIVTLSSRRLSGTGRLEDCATRGPFVGRDSSASYDEKGFSSQMIRAMESRL